MANIRKSLGKKAAKATVRHSINGVSSKAQRQPLRSATLLSVGGLLGATGGWFAGWFAGRKSS